MSMTEKGKFEVQKKKLQGICDEHNLIFKFRKDKYPIYLSIKPTNELTGQMSLLASDEDESYISQDAELIFSYKNGDLDICTKGTSFRIKESLIGKLKNLFKSMHFLWLQYFNREVLENELLSADKLPYISDEVSDSDAPDIDEDFEEVAADVEKIEDFDDDEDDEDGED